MFTVTKTYRDFPASHRQPTHKGHCRLIHGHNWGWDITFGCAVLDSNGFVVDVGQLARVRRFLEEKFDHTLLLNESDPLLPELRRVLEDGFNEAGIKLAKILLVPNCGMEGLAKYVFDEVTFMIPMLTEDAGPTNELGLHVVEVTCWEDSKNRATYKP